MTNPRDLVQLRALYQAGLLTEDEYTEARRRLLGYKIKRGKPVPPAAAGPVRPAATTQPSHHSTSRDGARPREHRSLNAQTQAKAKAPRNPDSDLPLIFALGALALVAIATTVWLLLG